MNDVDIDIGAAIVDETDRGAVIILGSIIEDSLANRIRQNFVDLTVEEDKRLFGADSPIGTFSSRIKVAYALGIIDREHVKMCDIIRSMRNSCAHSRRDISFATAELVDALDLLARPILGEPASSNSNREVSKVMFVWCVVYLTKVIMGKPLHQARTELENLIEAASDKAKAEFARFRNA
ncbi:hypothetical protein [uncultured Sphingomonas sp.]|uniref:hypothetical protein n=1 Tax=uncultured Sphingomonas sp. TaxID=158754 RepID=UPI0025DAEF2A|nr:hypothetical protein [uncultured Sphingomonas sp.]